MVLIEPASIIDNKEKVKGMNILSFNIKVVAKRNQNSKGTNDSYLLLEPNRKDIVDPEQKVPS